MKYYFLFLVTTSIQRNLFPSILASLVTITLNSLSPRVIKPNTTFSL